MSNHRMLLWCKGFIQFLLAAGTSLPGHSGSSALPGVLKGCFVGEALSVLHPLSSWHSSPAPQHPSSAADPPCFPTGDQSPFTAQCNQSSRVGCGWKALGSWRQDAAGRAPPETLTW